MTPEEKPYTLGTLVSTLAALALEGAIMVAGLTWLATHDPHIGMGVAYLFSVLIALFSVGMAVLQIHYYQQDRSSKYE